MELRYLSEFSLNHYSQKVKSIVEALPKNSLALFEVNDPTITQEICEQNLALLLEQAVVNPEEATELWLASQQFNIHKLFPLKDTSKYIAILIDKNDDIKISSYYADNQAEHLQNIANCLQGKLKSPYLYTYLTNKLSKNLIKKLTSDLVKREFPLLISDANLVSQFIPEKITHLLTEKKEDLFNQLDLALLAIESNCYLSYQEQRCVQHASENLTFANNLFWANLINKISPDNLEKDFNKHALKFDLKKVKFTFKAFNLDQINDYQGQEVEINKAISKQHLSPELQKYSSLISDKYNDYLTNHYQYINFFKQGINIEVKGEYLGYQAKVGRFFFYNQLETNAVKLQEHKQENRKRGTKALNNFDYKLDSLVVRKEHNFEKQEYLDAISQELAELELSMQRSLRPNITILHAVVNGIINGTKLGQNLKEKHQGLEQLFNLFYLQKNNKHLPKLAEQLELEQNVTIQALYQAIFKGLSKEAFTHENEQVQQVYQQFYAFEERIYVNYHQHYLCVNADSFTIYLENLNSGMILKTDTILQEGMALAITYKKDRLAITDSYLIADNLVLRKNLSVGSPVANNFQLQK
ncbi:hypothetical protein CKF54_04830 [Psittacicella hinzii]|uniref:Uncharacterized protein n=1 Tax=Psittacicella hinzii TaxID=2028575 RepID=A0A3A1Y4S6_9GAMM|nr:hypothetical protein [Psittacicella hinzii]RIY32390.1 hypothetical protein CKF54_04830 [Psittacicella hinzii]